MLHAAAILVIIVALHEGVLAPLGFDGLSAWRGQADHLPLTAIAWGVATALLALRTAEDLMRLGRGEVVRPVSAMLGASAGLGALGVAWTHATGDLQSIAQASFFAAWGVEILALNFLGRGVGARRPQRGMRNGYMLALRRRSGRYWRSHSPRSALGRPSRPPPR
jgi:hypothetical protein